MDGQLYDDTTELQLNELICKLDENPNISVDPVEASSYLKFNLYFSEEGFQRHIEIKYKQYLEYLDHYNSVNSVSPEGQTQLVLTLNRLLSKYQRARERIMNSPVRLEWKMQATSFTVPNPKNDYILQNQQKYTREAYRFFYKMSSTQLFFLSGIEEYLTMQLKPFNGVIREQIIKADLSHQAANKTEIYHFII